MLARPFKTQNGMAVIEIIPIMIIMVLLINFSIGFFGIVHTANLNAMAARNYTFETMRNRSNLVYHRDNKINYLANGDRFNGIISQNTTQDAWIATARRLSWVQFFGGTSAQSGADLSSESPADGQQKQAHNSGPLSISDGGAPTTVEVYNVWIRSLYGICLDSKCGD